MELVQFSLLLSWCRIMAFLALLPPLLGEPVPWKVRIFLSLPLSVGISPSGNFPTPEFLDLAALQILAEILSGLFWGGMVYLFFSALELAGKWQGEMIEGASREDNPWKDLYPLMGWALFFQLGLHQLLIQGLSLTYRCTLAASPLEGFLLLPGQFFALALLLSSPFLFLSLLMALAEGIWRRVFQKGDSTLLGWGKGGGMVLVLYFLPLWITKVMENYFYWVSSSLEKAL